MTEALTDTPPRHDAPEAESSPEDPPRPAATSGGDGGGEPPRGFFGRRRHAFADAFRRFVQMPVEGFVSLTIVAICVVFVFAQLGPGNIFSDSTPAGGDMGAHVWGPAYLRDNLLPQGRLTGWTPDWYAGFPAYQFYMVLPSLVIALLSYVLPYGVAFKLVAISGLLSLPVAAWAFGRLNRLPFPAPPLLAVGATLFLFDRSFSILGGNIASTLAGEFAFSIALSFALLYLGVLGRGMRDGTHRGWAALLLALTALCHPIPLFFAIGGTVIWFVLSLSWSRLKPMLAAGLAVASLAIGLLLSAVTDIYRAEFDVGWVRYVVLTAMVGLVLYVVAVMATELPKARLLYLATTLPIAGAISAFWTVPFYLRHGYMNDMGWEKKTDYNNFLFSREALDGQLVDSPGIKWLLAVAGVGALMAIVYGVAERNRALAFWLVMAVVTAVAFVVAPQGRLWNARLLPFYYLSLYLLAAIGVAYLGRTLAMLIARDPDRPVRWVQAAVAGVGLCVALLVLAVPLRAMPSWVGIPFTSVGVDLEQENTGSTYKWWILPETTDNSFIDSWARWNFSGYEGKPSYPEYHAVISTMDQLGQDRGCGRAMWEHEEEHNRYGTPMALMLLPFWTDGCIGSMEGLYFEASGTTPYHFINQDELSSAPSNAQRDLPYIAGAPSQSQFDQGVDHLQMLGVRYYMAVSERMVDFARKNPELTEVASTYDWRVFEVAGSELVTPLTNEPAVLEGLPSNGKGWLDPTMDWYIDQDAWDVPLAADGPEEWQRIEEGVEPEARPVAPVTVSNIEEGTDSIEFDVSEPGTPVVVKASYFPNWKASGAEGPWRISPNLMVVVPTSNHVELHYGWTGIDVLGWGLALVGVAGLVWLFRAHPLAMPEPAAPRVRRRARRPDAEFDADTEAEADTDIDTVADITIAGAGAEADRPTTEPGDPDMTDR